ncbi:uncharacterized protein V1513DRAFT_452325 [Lipomyces chichibuensis]|uniref:uncharacterized protein n=1 Tax=Lipomyces chichibuensis TaxID=1546026 RepID=UPI00334400B5
MLYKLQHLLLLSVCRALLCPENICSRGKQLLVVPPNRCPYRCQSILRRRNSTHLRHCQVSMCYHSMKCPADQWGRKRANPDVRVQDSIL